MWTINSRNTTGRTEIICDLNEVYYVSNDLVSFLQPHPTINVSKLMATYKAGNSKAGDAAVQNSSLHASGI